MCSRSKPCVVEQLKTLSGEVRVASDGDGDVKHEEDDVKYKKDAEAIFVEPFYGGSHRQLIDTLLEVVPNSVVVTLKPKKWHWRARCGALVLSNLIPRVTTERTLFCSSVLSLAELLGVRPDLQPLKKIVYFHENQMVYPIRDIKQRDVQYAYNEILTCLAADVVLFNSYYNRDTFLNNIQTIVKLLPDYRPKDLKLKIERKCKVLYFPIKFPSVLLTETTKPAVLHIAWPHRWEYDKNPDLFVKLLCQLKDDEGLDFKVCFLGSTYCDVPSSFSVAKEKLNSHISDFGYLPVKEDYFEVLRRCHVVVSTAKHEFFGVAMLEATFCGCYPLAPNSLAYADIYPSECLYATENELFERLKGYCLNPNSAVWHMAALEMDCDKYASCNLLPKYKQLFECD